MWLKVNSETLVGKTIVEVSSDPENYEADTIFPIIRLKNENGEDDEIFGSQSAECTTLQEIDGQLINICVETVERCSNHLLINGKHKLYITQLYRFVEDKKVEKHFFNCVIS